MKERTNWRRAGLLILLIVLCMVITALFRREDAGFLRKHGDIGTLDFIQYWSAHKVLVSGQNPYDPALLYGVQVAEGLRDPTPVIMWNPPWLVTLVLPVLSFSFLTSSALWFALNIVFIALTGVLVQAAYADRVQRDPIGLVAMFLFMPHISTLYCGQLGLLFAISVGTFLFGARKNAPALMGLGLVPLTGKPHLFYLAAIYLAYWILIGRRWKVILWFALGFGVLVLATSLRFPDAIREWVAALGQPPTHWVVCTLVGVVRNAVFRLSGEVPSWPLLVIPGCTAVGLGVWLALRRSVPDILRELPAVLALSLFTAPYGWLHDQALLVVVQVGLVTLYGPALVNQGTRRIVFGTLMLVQALAVAQTVLGFRHHHDYFWMSLALGGIWVLGRRKTETNLGPAFHNLVRNHNGSH